MGSPRGSKLLVFRFERARSGARFWWSLHDIARFVLLPSRQGGSRSKTAWRAVQKRWNSWDNMAREFEQQPGLRRGMALRTAQHAMKRRDGLSVASGEFCRSLRQPPHRSWRCWRGWPSQTRRGAVVRTPRQRGQRWLCLPACASDPSSTCYALRSGLWMRIPRACGPLPAVLSRFLAGVACWIVPHSGRPPVGRRSAGAPPCRRATCRSSARRPTSLGCWCEWVGAACMW